MGFGDLMIHDQGPLCEINSQTSIEITSLITRVLWASYHVEVFRSFMLITCYWHGENELHVHAGARWFKYQPTCIAALNFSGAYHTK
jgi:hypothetical protein